MRSNLPVLALLLVASLALSGCGGGGGGPAATPGKVSASDSLFPNLKTGRLGFPNDWKSFEHRVQDMSMGLLNEPVTVEGAAAMAEQARVLAKSDRRGHPHSASTIPNGMILCAQVFAKAGDDEQAFKLLEEVRDMGGVFPDMLARDAFDGIRETERFKALVAAGEAESMDDISGAYLVRLPPLFPLEDLLKIPAEPPLPSPAELKGKVTVVYTGPKLDADALETLKIAAEQGASAHAIIAEPAEVPAGITVHVASVSPDQLRVDRSPMTWFADKDGQVVAFLRPLSGANFAKVIVIKLSGAGAKQAAANGLRIVR